MVSTYQCLLKLTFCYLKFCEISRNILSDNQKLENPTAWKKPHKNSRKIPYLICFQKFLRTGCQSGKYLTILSNNI